MNTTLTKAVENRFKLVDQIYSMYEQNILNENELTELFCKKEELELLIKNQVDINFKIKKTTYTTECTIKMDTESAKLVAKSLVNVSKSSWDYSTIVRPIRCQLRAKQSEITLYTEGFGISDISQKLNNLFGEKCYSVTEL